MQHLMQYLPSDPETALSVEYTPGSPNSALIIFFNGLAQPASSWSLSIAHFLSLVSSSSHKDSEPGLLTWDRYGQGRSEKQAKLHDANDVVKTAHELFSQVVGKEGFAKRQLILVGNSIGVPLARLYASAHPRNVRGILMLDSMIANTDFVSLLDEPDHEQITETERADLAAAREKVRLIFHPTVPNKEGFDRSNMPEILPRSDEPKLGGDGCASPWITVLGHDFDFFAKDTEMKMGIPQYISQRYTNVSWHKYNEGLVTLTSSDRARGPIRPDNADHFIQLTRWDAVGQELFELYKKVINEEHHL